MKLTPITIDNIEYPYELKSFLTNANLYDSSCSQTAKVTYIDKDCGYFLKYSAKGTLEKEAKMMNYFHSKGLTSKVLSYISNDNDWLLTEKIKGEDCLNNRYIESPERLCDIMAHQLSLLHSMDYTDCPTPNHTELYLQQARQNRASGNYDTTNFPDSFGYESADTAWSIVEKHHTLLRTDTLLHGDYCMPNIILNNFEFSGFIDLGNGGVGDKHVDIFWGLWTLWFNLRTHEYDNRFISAYGRDKVDNDILNVIAAIEVFG